MIILPMIVPSPGGGGVPPMNRYQALFLVSCIAVGTGWYTRESWLPKFPDAP